MTVSTLAKSARRTVLLVAVAAASLATVQVASAQTAVSNQQARQLIAPFYEMLNKPAGKDLKAMAEATIAPNWRSFSGEGKFKTREEFVATAGGLGKLIPDLAWSIKDVLVDGDRIIVRGEATGTPAGPFFGVPVSGKSFRIMSIDIHTVKDGKLVEAHHVEDWASALQQLRAD